MEAPSTKWTIQKPTYHLEPRAVGRHEHRKWLLGTKVAVTPFPAVLRAHVRVQFSEDACAFNGAPELIPHIYLLEEQIVIHSLFIMLC